LRLIGSGCVGFEGVEVGFGDVAAADFGEIVEGVGFALCAVNPKIARFDAKRAELLGKPKVGGGFAFERSSPGSVRGGVEFEQEVASKKAVGFAVVEDDEDVEEQGPDRVLVVAASAEVNGGLTGEIGPWSASDIGEGK